MTRSRAPPSSGGFFPCSRTTSGLVVTVVPEAMLVSSGRRHNKYVVAVKVKALELQSL
jgi:hypothetical protein